MKQLQSMSAFAALNEKDMTQLRGGNGYTTFESAVKTEGNSKNIYDNCGKVLCISHWTSDCEDETGIEYYGTWVTYP